MAVSPPQTPDSQLPTYTDSHAPTPASPQQAPQHAGIASALARFEYEAGHTSVATGTKVLLIEWEDGELVRGRGGEWTVEWKGRAQKLLAEEGGKTPADADADFGEIKDVAPDQVPTLRSRAHSLPSSRERTTHRLYFILPAGTPVPSVITISFAPTAPMSSSAPASALTVSIPTLPAIFPPSLLTTGTAQGKKGVLHTLWAKSRLHALRSEMLREEEADAASEGMRAAQTEFEWICDNFGIGDQYGSDMLSPGALDNRGSERLSTLSDASTATSPGPVQSSTSPYPTTPVSPGGAERFLSKMRGLRVGTNESAWSPGAHNDPTAQLSQPTPPQTTSSNAAARNPLSPEAGDVAVGSFAAIKGPISSHAAQAQVQGQATSGSAATSSNRGRTAVPIAPPSEIAAQQEMGFGGMASLGDMTGGASRKGQQPQTSTSLSDEEHDDELFALPISPRSPEMAKSPFSWDQQDVKRAAAAVGR